ncbi:MAG: nuclear transport factor 2 family protein [Acidimicrobiia bacterium]
MADREAIENQLMSWALGYDEFDVPRMAHVFAQDAQMIMHIGLGDNVEHMGPYVGHDAVMGLFTSHQEEQGDQRRHVTTNVVFENETDSTCDTTCYLTLLVTSNNVLRLQATGVYRDNWIVEDGVWRIKNRDLSLDVHY